MFSQAIVPCFLKEKLFQNKLFYAKNVKTAGQFKLSEVIFQNMDQNENTCTKKKNPKNNSKLTVFILGAIFVKI